MKKMVSLLSEISSESRIEILNMLLEKDMRPSAISKVLRISIPGTQKHLNKLESLNLIEKNSKSIISITDLGKTILHILPSFNFLASKHSYIKNHSLSFLPPKFINRIGELQESTIVTGYIKIIETYKEMILSSKKYVKHCTATIPLDTYKLAIPHFKKHKVKMNFILAKDMMLPKGWKTLQRTLGEEYLVKKGLYHRKMIDKIDATVWVSENICSIILPNTKGDLTVRHMLVSTDDTFREWCSDYFDYLWSKSYSFIHAYVREE